MEQSSQSSSQEWLYLNVNSDADVVLRHNTITVRESIAEPRRVIFRLYPSRTTVSLQNNAIYNTLISVTYMYRGVLEVTDNMFANSGIDSSAGSRYSSIDVFRNSFFCATNVALKSYQASASGIPINATQNYFDVSQTWPLSARLFDNNYDIRAGPIYTSPLLQYPSQTAPHEAFTCNNCPAGCLECSGASCTSCRPGSHLDVQTGKCACDLFFFDASNSGACIEITCTRCSESEYTITACNTTSPTTCGSCHPACKSCYGPAANNCSSCDTTAGLMLDAPSSSCDCQHDYFKKSLSDISCSPCVQCLSGEFESRACSMSTNRQCLQCHDSCATCSNSTDTDCLSCNSNSELQLDGTCVCSSGFTYNAETHQCEPCHACEVNEFESVPCSPVIQRQCQSCHHSCASCRNASEYDCITCGLHAHLSSDGTCSCDMDYTYNSLAQTCEFCTVCRSHEYEAVACSMEYDRSCVTCDASCQTCDGPLASNCTSCAVHAHVSAGRCQCNANYTYDSFSNTCQLCSACSSAQYEGSECSHDADRECRACDSSCETCTGPLASSCTSCSVHAHVSAGQCQCDADYTYDSSSNTCQLCSACSSAQYEGSECSHDADRECRACDSSCQTCSGPLASNCTCCSAHAHVAAGRCQCDADYI
jgi:TNFR/NGFR cysteine-rich region